MNLELQAIRWLLYERKCYLALCERSPRAWCCGEPDALGITKARYMVEVEIKRTLSDFRADRQKRSREENYRAVHAHRLPKEFYYLVPKELGDSVREKLPVWAGLLTWNGVTVSTVVVAPVNRESKRLDLKESVKLARAIANHSVSAMGEADTWHRKWQE
jgi:hypothetical protein